MNQLLRIRPAGKTAELHRPASMSLLHGRRFARHIGTRSARSPIWGPKRAFQAPIRRVPGLSTWSRWVRSQARLRAPTRPGRAARSRTHGRFPLRSGSASTMARPRQRPARPRGVRLRCRLAGRQVDGNAAGGRSRGGGQSNRERRSRRGVSGRRAFPERSTRSTPPVIVAPIKRSLTRRSIIGEEYIRADSRAAARRALRANPSPARRCERSRISRSDRCGPRRAAAALNAAATPSIACAGAVPMPPDIRAANWRAARPASAFGRGKPPFIDAIGERRCDAGGVLVAEDAAHRQRASGARHRRADSPRAPRPQPGCARHPG